MKTLELIETCAAAVLILGVAIIVVMGCLLLLPFQALKPRSADERLRERANLVMLKAGRFGT